MEKYLSKCCNGEVKVEGDVTMFHVCLVCGNPCDVYAESQTSSLPVEQPKDLPKFSIREVSRRTKKVMENLPCIVTYDKKPIAIITRYVKLQNRKAVQDVHAPGPEVDRGAVPDNAEGAHLQSFS